MRSVLQYFSYRGQVLVQIVVVIHLRLPRVVLVLRLLVGVAPGVGGETDGAVRQILGAADHWVDSEPVEFVIQGLGDCWESLWK